MARLYKPKFMELVQVEWRDSYYDPVTDGPPEDYTDRVAHLLSIGFFVKRGRDGLVLASCREAKEGTCRHYVTIPRENVKTVLPLIGGTNEGQGSSPVGGDL